MPMRFYFCATAALILAAGAATSATAGTKATKVPGIRVFDAPPANLDPVLATAQQRAAYGIPPAPDLVKAPRAYEKWRRAMKSARTHELVTVQPTSMISGPNVQLMGPASIHGVASPTLATSAGWSGTSIVANPGTFLGQEIQASFTVPKVQPAPNSCVSSSPNSYVSQWIGIDGNGSPDVLQAGVELVASCGKKTSYSPWIEWYPNTLTQVSSPAISAGDFVTVTLWATSATTANVTFVDQTTNVSASYQLTAPTGTTLVGNSVEWVIENPTVNGAPAVFGDYTVSSWEGGVAWNYQSLTPTYYYSGDLTPPNGSLMEVISMPDASGNIISAPTVENDEFLFFRSY